MAAAWGAALAAACGSTGTGQGEAPAASKGPTTLRVSAQVGSGSNVPQWQPVWDAWAQQHPTVKLDTEGFIGSPVTEYRTKLLTSLAGGELFDAVHLHISITGDFVAKGLTRPLDTLAGKDKEVKLDDFPQFLLDAYKWKGKLQGLPVEANPWAIWFNRDLFTKYGVKTPAEHAKTGKWNLDQFLATAKEMTRGSGDDKTWGYAGWNLPIGVSGYAAWLPFVYSLGGDIWTKDLSNIALDSPAALNALQYYADLILKHQVTPPVDQSKLWDHSTGKVGMGFFAPFTTPNFKKYDWQPGMVLMASGSAGSFHNSGASMYGITNASKQPDAAWQFVKWISNDGIKVWLDAGFITAPQRKSLTQYKGWLANRLDWEDAAVWSKATETIRVPLSLPGWDAIRQALAAELDKAMKGDQTPAQAITKAKPAIGDIIKKEGAT
jgi:multiple sugar transport system substrate-binding protein